MPAWTNDPLLPVKSLTPGTPAYCAGGLRPGPVAKFLITQTAVAANVVTLTGTMVEGLIPAVGDLIYTYATLNDAGALNQKTGIALATVVIDAVTGIGTVTFPLTASNLAPTADVGYAQIVPGEFSETSVPSQAYQAFNIPKGAPELAPNRSITMNLRFPSAPASILVSLQGSMRNVDTEFVDLIASVTAAGTFSDSGAPAQEAATAQFWPGTWNFVRIKDKGSSGGTLPTIIAKLMT